MMKLILELVGLLLNIVCMVMAIFYVYKFSVSHAMYHFQWAVIFLLCSGGLTR